jgi:hypothetical protein
MQTKLDDDSVEELDTVEVLRKKVEKVRCDGKCLRSGLAAPEEEIMGFGNTTSMEPLPVWKKGAV